MDALMICLIGSAVAAFGGRWWLTVAAVQPTLPPPALMAAIAVSTGINVAAAAIAGTWLAQQIAGPGMLLFLALAILAAALSMLWPSRPAPLPTMAQARGPISATVLLTLTQFGDSAIFLILAAAALTGMGWLAAIGGAAGLCAAAVSAMAFAVPFSASRTLQQRIRTARLSAGVLFAVIGAVTALTAMGRI